MGRALPAPTPAAEADPAPIARLAMATRRRRPRAPSQPKPPTPAATVQVALADCQLASVPPPRVPSPRSFPTRRSCQRHPPRRTCATTRVGRRAQGTGRAAAAHAAGTAGAAGACCATVSHTGHPWPQGHRATSGASPGRPRRISRAASNHCRTSKAGSRRVAMARKSQQWGARQAARTATAGRGCSSSSSEGIRACRHSQRRTRCIPPPRRRRSR